MKLRILAVALICLMTKLTFAAVNDRILLDFDYTPANPTIVDGAGNQWNTIPYEAVFGAWLQKTANLKTTANTDSNIGLWTYEIPNLGGTSTGGGYPIENPDIPDSGIYPDSAMMSGWVALPSPSQSEASRIKLSGLTGQAYDLTIFGSRTSAAPAGGNRIGTYTINDVSQNLDCAFNTSNTITFTSVVPVNGEIVLSYIGSTFDQPIPGAGYSYAYLNVLDIIERSLALLGDLNNDSIVNNQDIASFVLALTDLPSWQAQFPTVNILDVGDINGDSFFNNQDIAPFVTLLTGGGTSLSAGEVNAIPEPASLGLLAIGGLMLSLRGRHRRA